MVRVISVHHFASQHIQTVEQPTACTVAPPDRLLLALTSNCVEVRDLKNESDVLFTFPSVDEVIQIIHCRNGDFVATLEAKFNRQNKDTNFVRVYINWDSVATLQQSKMTQSGVSLGASECGMVQPMRARIAGRVTPTTNQSELGNLEMIEIPVKLNPNLIACCQISGNLFLLSNRTIHIYRFLVRTHDISKMRFIDFSEMNLCVELAFSPIQFDVCENYIACFAHDSMHLFRVNGSGGGTEERLHFEAQQEDTLDYDQLLKEELHNFHKNKMTVNLPSVVKDNSIIHKHSPFTFTDREMTAKIHTTENYETKDLIQLRLVPILVENAQRQITEEFKSMILKPLYVDESLNNNRKLSDDVKLWKSDFSQCLTGVVCMVATQQEGYLHYFSAFDGDDGDNCIAVYPFTAPVQQLVMEDSFLHALTETGLESYTLRYGHKMCRTVETVDNANVACPPISDSICLVGLRPFLNVERILQSEHNLVLLANSDSSPTHSVSSSTSSTASYWTLYNLELPTPKTIFNDISIVANVHRFTSPVTYRHLLSEAHVILRVALLLKQWTITDDNVKLILSNKGNDDDVVETYRTSCALLGDHFIMCTNENEWKLAIAYYQMARVMPFEVLRRVRKVQEQSNNHSTRGLVHYLKTVLLAVKYSWEAEKFFSGGTKQNFAETLLGLLETHNFDDLPNLILQSHILREYSTDKLIQILSDILINDDSRNPEKFLSLAILFIQKCNEQKALECLLEIGTTNLETILYQHWELLFDSSLTHHSKLKSTTFSELSTLLISTHSEILSNILVRLITEKKSLNLHKLIKIFLEYLPSSIGSDSITASNLLQKTLELYFERKVGNTELSKFNVSEKGTNEALKLLARSYLSQLQIFQLKEETISTHNLNLKNLESELFGENEEKKCYFEDKSDRGGRKKENFLFGSVRYEYLDKMAPFQVEITGKLYEACMENYSGKPEHTTNEEADVVLKKLQALLCSHAVPKQVLTEVHTLISLNENLRGNLSLQSILMNSNDAIQLLIDSCPQCLLQFGKDRFTKTDEWKLLIATVQRRILRLSQNEALKRVCFFHKKLLKDILTYVATTLTLDQLVQVFPQRFSTSSGEDNKVTELGFVENELDVLNEIQNYEPYVLICKDTMHANQINKLITTTGQQLLCTLNL